MTANVEVVNLTHRFGDFAALKEVNLTVASGEFAVLLGPSGCGKTTLLSVLGGFIAPTRGQVTIGGKDVTRLGPAKRATTTMFQDYALFPHMTVGANVGFGLRMRGVGRAERDRRAAEVLGLVGLADAFLKKPHELSGGQRQRVALARALAVEPDVLLLDEPLGALDLKLRRQMQNELKAIQRRVGTTFIHVTHDQEEAMAIADTIIVMGDGEIVDRGSPEDIYLRPRRRFSAAFMGEANFVGSRVKAVGAKSLTLESPFGEVAGQAPRGSDTTFAAGDDALLCLRPEHVSAGRPKRGQIGMGEGVIREIAFFGIHHRARVALEALGGQEITAHLPQNMIAAPGEAMQFSADADAIIVLANE